VSFVSTANEFMTTFTDLLDYELKKAESQHKRLSTMGKSKGRELDPRGEVAAQEALKLIDGDYPWRQNPTLSPKGPWMRLSSLLFEVASGKRNHNMRRYCDKLHKARARLRTA